MRARIQNVLLLLAVVAAMLIPSPACRVKVVPPPPPPSKVSWNFDLVFNCPALFTVDGIQGLHGTTGGYIYIKDLPAAPGPDGKPTITHGHVRAHCDGFDDFDQDISWQDAETQNATLDDVGQPEHNWLFLTPSKPHMPRPPSKRELMEAQSTFQGLRANCPEYDSRPLPIFEIDMDAMTESCRQAHLASKRAAGDQVVIVAVSHAYFEPGIEVPISSGHDWTYDLPGLRAYLTGLIQDGWLIDLRLAGDGQSVRELNTGKWRYNDAVGWTYGYQFLREFFPSLVSALQQEPSLVPYIRFTIGFDGVFYGWDPEQVVAFGDQFVQLLGPDAVLGIEHDFGHIPLGEGGDDYRPGGRMKNFSIVYGEYPDDLQGDDVWQILGRMVFPYLRPPEQPANDDPRPPYYLRGWPGLYNCFEWGTYPDVRFKTSPEQIQAGRMKLRTMGCTITG